MSGKDRCNEHARLLHRITISMAAGGLSPVCIVALARPLLDRPGNQYGSKDNYSGCTQEG
jgi:hypothetical protein